MTLQLSKTGLIRPELGARQVQPLPGGAKIPATSLNLGGVALALAS